MSACTCVRCMGEAPEPEPEGSLDDDQLQALAALRDAWAAAKRCGLTTVLSERYDSKVAVYSLDMSLEDAVDDHEAVLDPPRKVA